MGRHERRGEGRRHSPPPPEPARQVAPETVIPQRERVTYLVHLADAFAAMTGLITAYAVIDGYMVLNVIPVESDRRARTIGLRYVDGQWWFVHHRTERLIRPANELSAAAQQIRTEMEEDSRHDHPGDPELPLRPG